MASFSTANQEANTAERSSDVDFIEVISPVNGKYLGKVPVTSPERLAIVVKTASEAFTSWSRTPVKERVQIFFRYKELLHTHSRELAELIHQENGKIISEALAEIDKSIEITEFACSLPQLITGELLEVSRDIECRSEYFPLGVVASITPFNFPAMVPHWTVPIAIALGNCMILKPSEKVPLSALRMGELLQKAGLPDGVLSVVNGYAPLAEAICQHPDIEAISFVGSTNTAKKVYKMSTNALKNCLALGGAKNHIFVLPDAVPSMTAKNIVASMSGCAGQRCMAASAMLAVGSVDHIIEKICDEVNKMVPAKDFGAVISPEAKTRIEYYISDAEAHGARILVDGRNLTVPGNEGGYYVGPTVIDRVTPDMKIAKEEVFGPVICIIQTNTLEEALKIENGNVYGNAASVFTQNGALARRVIDGASAGMIGVNIGVPVPREPFSFGGWNESKFGTGDITGKSSIGFWTKLKKSTIKWHPEAGVNWMS